MERRLSLMNIINVFGNRRWRLNFYLLLEEDVIDEKSDFNSLECQIGNLVLSHDYHLPSRGKPTTNCLFQRGLYQKVFRL